MSYYQPKIDPSFWTGRYDASLHDYLFQDIHYLDLSQNKLPYQNHFTLLGFACDTGIQRNQGRPGACLGPNAIRQQLAKLSNPSAIPLMDAGNIENMGNNLEQAQEELAEKVKKILDFGYFPIVLGGGHETAWGHFLGLKQHYLHDKIAILNFDAHFDLRPGQQAHSGSAFRQIHDYLQQRQEPFHYYCCGIQSAANPPSLIQFAKTAKVNYLLAEEIEQNPQDFTWIDHLIQKHDKIYVSICMDVFAASIAPGVSAPQVLGLQAHYVLKALKRLKQSKKVIALDVVELSPPLDIDHQTAKLAAHLIWTYLQSKKQE